MALFALSDLHLSFGINKPMDVFGPSWQDYMQRIHDNWYGSVCDDDLVVVGGDLSWATYLDEAKADFEFLHTLPGKKLLIKGNHDYWWESVTKLNAFIAANGYDSISFLHNTAYVYGDFVIAGTRGWLLPSADGFNLTDKKIYGRELIRLSLSLDEALRLEHMHQKELKKIAVLHYPPLMPDGTPDEEISGILKKYNVKSCIYGHLHGNALRSVQPVLSDGIRYSLTSADYLNFNPVEIT